ncbi:hypothetical protein vseg_000880 [Gypsophila vaccaria]
MEVTEDAQNPPKQFEEAKRRNRNVKNATRNQYLESARGHYISALNGRYPEKQEQYNTCAILGASSVAADNASYKVEEAEEPTIPEQLEQLMTSIGKDVQMQFSKALYQGSELHSQAVMMHVNGKLSRCTTSQLAYVVDRLGVIPKEIDRMDAPNLKPMTPVFSDFGNAEESLCKGMSESSGLKKTVESLKAELEKLKREHAETNDNDVGAESVLKNRQLMIFHRQPENVGCLDSKANREFEHEEVAHNTEVLNIKARGVKRDKGSLRSCSEAEKRPKITLTINETKESSMTALDLSHSLSERMCTTCVSTSESGAGIRNLEDELESSTQQQEKSNNLEKGKMAEINGRIEPGKHELCSDFSIRNYVFSARNKDISTNWPFSQKNLQLCLKHGIKDVLPPFQSVYSFRDVSAKRCLAEKSVSTEESNIDKRPSVTKKYQSRGTTIDCRWNQEFAKGYKDQTSFPSVGEKDLEFHTVAAVCQSEVGSVSTSNLPLSEALSEEQEAAASAANKKKSSVSQIFDKKCGVTLKSSVNSRRGAPDDITSACTFPSEAMASKICPVCNSFSSSSNTTLNAHIDQCLSSQSNPKWVKNSKVTYPRIKPRKMRTMADICATAPRCTLEDLDRRNGSNWAVNREIPSEDTELHTEGSSHRVISRHTVNKHDDGCVYIDSNGRKIRIISKFNDMPLSIPKLREDSKVRKQSKKGKRCRLFSSSRKRRIVNHLKYLRVARQRKHLMSVKVKGRSAEACVAKEATCAGYRSDVVHQPPLSFSKDPQVHEQKNQIASETSSKCTSSKKINSAKKNVPEATTKISRYDFRVRNDSSAGLSIDGIRGHTVNKKNLLKNRSPLPKKPLCSVRWSLRTSVYDSAGQDKKSWGSSSGMTLGSPPPRSEIQSNREPFEVPLKSMAPGFNGEHPKECLSMPMDYKANPVSSLQRGIETQSDAKHSTGSQKMLHSCHANPSEKMRLSDSETGMPSPDPSYAGDCRPISRLKGSAVDNSSAGRVDEETKAWSTDSGEQYGANQDYNQNGLRDRYKHTDGGEGKYCLTRSAETSHGSKDFNDPVSSARFAVRETDIKLNPRADPELQKVVDVSVPLPKTMQSINNQRSLSRDESTAYFAQADLMEEQLFYRDVSAAARSELKTGIVSFSFGEGSSLMTVDPIPIPGPPGCDLPSFSDMGSEDLLRTSSSSTSLEQSFGDGHGVVDGDSSDSRFSATSTVFNLGVIDDHAYPGWLAASSSVDALTVFSQSTAVRTERVASADSNLKEGPCSGQQCCCSRKEGIPWSAAIYFPESQLQGQRMASLTSFPGEPLADSTMTKRPYAVDDSISFNTCQRIESENLVNLVEKSHKNVMSWKISAEVAARAHRNDECDSSSSAPILRLMGKDLMVVNNEEDDLSLGRAAQNVCMNKKMHTVTETLSKHGIPEHLSSHSPALMGPQPYEQDPHIFSMQCFDVVPSYMINSFGNLNYASGDMYVNMHMQSRFSVLGAAHLQR